MIDAQLTPLGTQQFPFTPHPPTGDPMFGTLFETPEDCAIAQIDAILGGVTHAGHTPTPRQLALLRILRSRRGLRSAISIGELCERLKTTPRTIKADVRDLRLFFRVRVGSSRSSEEGGVYLITNREEWLATVTPYLQQARSEIAVVRAFSNPQELLELEGQLQLQEASDAE